MGERGKIQSWPATQECPFGIWAKGEDILLLLLLFFNYLPFPIKERWTHSSTTWQTHYLSFINLVIEIEKQLFMLFMLKHNLLLKISRFLQLLNILSSDVNRTFNCLKTGKLGTEYCVLIVEVRIKTTLWFSPKCCCFFF